MGCEIQHQAPRLAGTNEHEPVTAVMGTAWQRRYAQATAVFFLLHCHRHFPIGRASRARAGNFILGRRGRLDLEWTCNLRRRAA